MLGLGLSVAHAGAIRSSLPTISSVTIDNATPTVGDALTASVIAVNADDFTYQWKAGGVAITGEINQVYTATRADAMGHALTVTAVANNAFGSSAPSTSSATAAVTGSPLCTVNPVVTTDGVNAPIGPAIIDNGDVLTTTDGTWTGFPEITAVTYGWLRDGTLIGGQSASSITPGNVSSPGSFVARITANNGIGGDKTQDSNAMTVNQS